VRAVAFRRFGGPEVLEVADLPDPQPGPGEVRVHVAAATVNPTDLGMRDGRRAADLEKLPPPYVPGMELAGTIDAVGSATEWGVGERVLAIVLPMRTGRGAQSEYVVVPSDSVARIPTGVGFEAAATLPMNGLTVRRALDLLGLKPGQTLLVTGAAGAVGGYAVQLGRQAGLRVIAIASSSDEALVRGLGAEVFVPRGENVVDVIRAQAPAGVDGVLDAALLGPTIVPAIRDGGGLAAVRGYAGEPGRGIQVHRVQVSDYAHNQAALAELARLVGEGQLALRVAETFPPERAADAHRKLEAGGVRGRLVLTF
jgi:NADPH2:quinone reductase